MRVSPIVTLLTVVLTGSASIPASAANRRNPFGNLFTGELKVDQRSTSPTTVFSLGQRPAQRRAQESRLVCGMTLIPADPNIDPAIRHIVPEHGPKFTMKIIQPPACRQ
jgi:hypothetical protein